MTASRLGIDVQYGHTLSTLLGLPATSQILGDGDLQTLAGDILDDVLSPRSSVVVDLPSLVIDVQRLTWPSGVEMERRVRPATK